MKGFFGKDNKDGAEKPTQNQQLSDESDSQFNSLEDQTFEPMELTSEKRSNQVCSLKVILFSRATLMAHLSEQAHSGVDAVASCKSVHAGGQQVL